MKPENPPSAPERYSTADLKKLYDEDQRDRRGEFSQTDWEEVERRDVKRRHAILGLLKNGRIQTPADCFHAAMILHHGHERRHYEAARTLAEKAAEGGYLPQDDEADPRWLAAAATDRLLMYEEKPQRYGTQYQRFADGTYHLYHVDPAVTDEERAAHNVPPLADMQRKIERLNAQQKK